MKIVRVLYILCFYNLSLFAYSQTVDDRIKELLAKEDYFTLRDEYPILKDSIKDELNHNLSVFYLDVFFNNAENITENFSRLLIHNKKDIEKLIPSFFLYESIYWMEKGEYTYVADRLNDYILNASKALDNNTLISLEYYQKLAAILRDVPKPEIVRPNVDSEVPLTANKVGEGQLLYIPVKINANDTQFIIDTGSPYNYVSANFAQKNDIHILPGSISIYGLGESYGQVGVTDSILIGNIVIRNPFFLVGSSSLKTDSIYQIDAILGLHQLKMLEEVRIYPKKEKIIFPISSYPFSNKKKRIMLKNNHLYTKANWNKKQLLFLLDTGHVTANMNKQFYEKERSWVHTYGRKEAVGISGVSNTHLLDVFILPSFNFSISNTNCKLNDLPVYTNNILPFEGNEDGILGTSFINQFDKIILNFKDMTLSLEE